MLGVPPARVEEDHADDVLVGTRLLEERLKHAPVRT
jgi:hypothetical protein